jgi:hypothetical protein
MGKANDASGYPKKLQVRDGEGAPRVVERDQVMNGGGERETPNDMLCNSQAVDTSACGMCGADQRMW